MKVTDIPIEHTLNFIKSSLPTDTKRVLEVGCGRGTFALKLQELGLEVTAIDVSAESVETARSLGVNATQANFIEYENSPFDSVLFTRSLHHIEPLSKAVENSYKLLKNGGTLIAEEFALERVDRQTAAWLYDLLATLEPTGMISLKDGLKLPAIDPWVYWQNEIKSPHRLSTGDEMIIALSQRFKLIKTENIAYLYRFICDRLKETEQGIQIAMRIFEIEKLRVNQGTLCPAGLRMVAQKLV